MVNIILFSKKNMEVVRMIMPFSNEVANILTLSGLNMFSGLYKDVPELKIEKLSKVFIDLIALFGIILNATHVTSKYGEVAGIFKGLIIIIIAFIIPNLTFHTIIKKFGLRRKPWQKLIFGLILIGLLSGLEILFDFLIVEKLHKKNNLNK